MIDGIEISRPAARVPGRLTALPGRGSFAYRCHYILCLAAGGGPKALGSRRGVASKHDAKARRHAETGTDITQATGQGPAGG